MTYYPRAPRWSPYHEPWYRAHIANSSIGSERAKANGDEWVDNDFHFSAPSKTPPPVPIDCDWINGHGAPELFWLPIHERFEDYPAAKLLKIERPTKGHVFKLRTLAEALKDNAAAGRKTEIEVKDVHPYNTPAILNRMFARAAVHAEAAYGADWKAHTVVKVLTDLRGGEAYALQVLAVAHAHGFQTMLLARGRCRFKRYAGHTEITYVRGSAVIR